MSSGPNTRPPLAGHTGVTTMPTRKTDFVALNKRNSLGMDTHVYAQLLKKLNDAEQRPDPRKPVSRKHTRLEYTDPYLELRLISPDSASRTITVASRNISRSGMSVLHSSFIYPGTGVSSNLRRSNGSTLPLRGKVVRCEHRGGVVHEIGIHFEQEIIVQEFLRPDINDAVRSYESVSPELLTGKILVVGSDTTIIPLLREYLQTTCINYGFLDNAPDALAKDLTEFALVLCCLELGDIGGPQFVRQLRETGYDKPVILTGASRDEYTRNQIRLSTADMFVPAPLSERDLMCALGEYLLTEWSERTLKTVRSGISRETVECLNRELARLGAMIDQQQQNADAVELYATCTKIRSIAPLLGMKSLRDLSLRIGEEIAANGQPESQAQGLREISRMCSGAPQAA